MTVLQFELLGRPQPQGSLKSFRHSKTGRPVTLNSNALLPVWRDELARTALTAARDAGLDGVLTAPVRVDATFRLRRPADHYGTGRNRGRLRSSAPAHPAVRPDCDKLARAVLDALTGTILLDDGQVVQLEARKIYGVPEAVVVTVRELRRTAL